MSEKPNRPPRPSISGGASKPASGSKATPGGSRPATGGAATNRAEVDRARLLRDVMDHAVRVHKETTAPFARKESHARAIMLGITMIVLMAASAYSWVARPEFIWGPKAEPLPAVEEEAGYRMAMFFVAQRVEAFRQAQGLYPSALAAIGEDIPGVTYTIVSDGVFELSTNLNGKRIVFRSDQSADEFLGNSTNIIQGFGRP